MLLGCHGGGLLVRGGSFPLHPLIFGGNIGLTVGHLTVGVALSGFTVLIWIFFNVVYIGAN